jgi:hypothetical protein
MELASHHFSSTQNFEAAPRFLESLYIHSCMNSVRNMVVQPCDVMYSVLQLC